MKELTKLSLFSGIGGDDLASEWAGIKTVCFVEKDKFCQQVLKKHWPTVPIIGDVKDVTKEKVIAYAKKRENFKRENGIMAETAEARKGSNPTSCLSNSDAGITLISGGFPCQPHSVAGKRKGSTDERDLWPEFRRIIGEIKPRWVVAENVPGLFSSDAGRFFGEVLADLASLGYSVGWCTFGAVDVGALHRRNRVFIVAHAGGDRQKRPCWLVSENGDTSPRDNTGNGGEDVANTSIQGLEGAEPKGTTSTTGLLAQCGDVPNTEHIELNREMGRFGRYTELTDSSWWAVEPNVGRVAHGVSRRVDRLKGLGNAVVPQQIYPIYKAIVEIENG